MKKPPSADAFIDPTGKVAAPKTPGAETFMALRGLGGAQAPDWVLEKFGLIQTQGNA